MGRILQDRRYLNRFAERLGSLPWREIQRGAVWVHAVSVGEVLTAVPLLKALKQELPSAPLFVSTATLAGRAVAEERLTGLADGIFFAPIDYAWCVRRVFRRLRPRALVVMETEIWPNLWREARRFGCALVVVNARISDRALPRYRRLRRFFRQVLRWPDALLVQSDRDRSRYGELGAPDPVRAGNLKYDFKPAGSPPAEIQALLEHLRPACVWIAASTMPPAEPGDPDEDEAVLAAFREAARPGLLLVLVPRKPERFDSSAALLRLEGVPFLRRSELRGDETLALPGVLLLDSIGELSSLFGLADVVFMGGTLPHRGGHNILEPAAFGKPVIVGPHMENFAEIAEKFVAAGAVVTIDGPSALGPAVRKLMDEPTWRSAIGEKARELAEAERGATGRAVSAIAELYWKAMPRSVPAARALVAPLTPLWLAGSAVKRRRDLHRRTRLETPVISVGGLTAGGAGKTPVVLWLAERLAGSAILTRGYRRNSRDPVILTAGQRAPAAVTGDEAQIYLRAAVGPVGIGSNRAAVGRDMERRLRPRVFLLDDGFQHWRLDRDFDLIVLDGQDPFGGGALLPLGRLREPVQAARRAHAVVVTRTSRTEAIEQALRASGYAGPVFTARLVSEAWIEAMSGEPASLPGCVGAFCGLGNPGSFWASLREMGIEPVFRRAFADHHKYSVAEMEGLARDVDALVTTEKDAANLPGDWRGRVLWLKVRLEIDRGEELLEMIHQIVDRGS